VRGALAALALLLLACARQAPPASDVAARIGEAEVRYPDLEAYIRETGGESPAALDPEVLSRLVDQFVDERLLLLLAAERGLATPADGPRRAVDALLAAEAAPPPGDAEVSAYYAAHSAEFVRPERVHLRQILVDDREAAEAARAEVRAGADFSEVASRLSRDPSAGRGGDQGELAREDLPTAFAETIFELEPGEVSEVLAAGYGYHVFQVVERLPREVVPLAEAAPAIQVELRRRHDDERLAALVEEARSRYHVKLYGRNLPFAYRGRYLAAGD
jgi:peptidyl-prolyl cis-trans isomerase C